MTIDQFIAEQPEVLEAVLAEVPGQLAALGPIQSARPLYLVGSGTSRNALVAVETLFVRLVPAGVRIRGPLAFLAEMDATRRRKGLAVFLSQTGTSATTVEAVARAATAIEQRIEDPLGEGHQALGQAAQSGGFSGYQHFKRQPGCLAPVAHLVFYFKGQLRHSFLQAGKVENGVIAEAIITFGFESYQTIAFSLA